MSLHSTLMYLRARPSIRWNVSCFALFPDVVICILLFMFIPVPQIFIYGYWLFPSLVSSPLTVAIIVVFFTKWYCSCSIGIYRMEQGHIYTYPCSKLSSRYAPFHSRGKYALDRFVCNLYLFGSIINDWLRHVKNFQNPMNVPKAFFSIYCHQKLLND